MSRTPRVDREAMESLENCGVPLPSEVLNDLSRAIRFFCDAPEGHAKKIDEWLLILGHMPRIEFIPGCKCLACRIVREPYKYEFFMSARWDDRYLYIRRFSATRTPIGENPRY